MKAICVFWILFLAVFALVAQPVITQQPTNQMVVAGTTAYFNVSVSDTGPFTYQWQWNGTNLPPSGSITTVAGNGNYGYSGDGGIATNAGFNPFDVAVDSNGNLFIADWGNNRIRKVDTNGIITTVAGNGDGQYVYSFGGDGGYATNAVLSCPGGVAVDSSDNIFIVDQFNGRIRKVDTNGIITTVAGAGNGGFFFGDSGYATNAGLNSPHGVAIDTVGNLFIADYGNNRIRKVDTNGIITTVAGNNNGGFSAGDGGYATNASLSWPEGVAVDASGNLFIADYGDSRVRKVDTNGIITTVAGNGNYGFSGDGGAATNAELTDAFGVAVDNSGNLFIADCENNRIREVTTSGIITTVAGYGTQAFFGDGGYATSAGLNNPFGVAVDSGGNLFIADQGNKRIRKVQNNPQNNLPTLVLSNVTINNAGNYSVVVSGSGGSVTSSVVSLTVLISIQLQHCNRRGLHGAILDESDAVVSLGYIGRNWLAVNTD
jgi:sugar lactone lactonase YvrE